MLTRLELKGFKNFKDAELNLGPFTVLVGTNASGKSNIRDAIRFLHGIGRGYNLAEIIGQKWGEEGVLLWKGIRGGVRTPYFGTNRFQLTAEFSSDLDPYGIVADTINSRYSITVEFPSNNQPPRVTNELFHLNYEPEIEEGKPLIAIFETERVPDVHQLRVRYCRDLRGGRNRFTKLYADHIPILSQLADDSQLRSECALKWSRVLLNQLRSIRFLDPSPDAMRFPSVPGQFILGDRGGELILCVARDLYRQGIQEDAHRVGKEPTPMDASDFRFPADQTGRVLLSLVEDNGRETSAFSASDGTLRFLAMLAALLGPEPADHYFVEEIDNGIHPTRLSLLIELIERQVDRKGAQLITTTHSPTLLGLLSEESLKHAALVYRIQDTPAAGIRRILDLPDAARIIKEHNAGRLLATGWLENAVAFTEEQEAAV